MATDIMASISEKTYWVDDFDISDNDLEHLYNLFLETETPQSLRDLTAQLISFHLETEKQRLQRRITAGIVFKPAESYSVGTKLVFPKMAYALGEVVQKREGNNPEYGDFSVIEVRFEDGKTREFASELKHDHVLNHVNGQETVDNSAPFDADTILRNYGKNIARKLRARFEENPDIVYLAGRWFLKSLLADVDLGHLHLAEAVLDMQGGGPLSTEAIWEQIGMPEQVNHRLQIFSFDYALQRDSRFDEVGPAGQVLWYLHRMEPDSVKSVPLPLQYEHKPYNHSILTDEMLDITLSIDDELSPIELPEDDDEEAVTITLTYPYRRTGTLPLSARLQHLFPTAYETSRIMTTLVDGHSNEEFDGWVVRDQGYVYGLEPIYRKYQIPIGAYVTVRRHSDSTKLIVSFNLRKPRTEWIPLVVPEGNRISFTTLKRSIGADYDDLMIFGIEDLTALDNLWLKTQRQDLTETLKMLMTELTTLSPQQNVHLKTLYSAMNLIRRCPPGPIFTTLIAESTFAHVAGPYWRLA